MAAWCNGLSGGINYKVMNIQIDLQGLEKVQGNFERRAAKTKQAVKNILYKSIFLVERHAKILAPVKTGRLRASIGGGSWNRKGSSGSFPKGEGMEITDKFASIGPTVVYAKWVHARTPFMRAGVYDAQAEIQKVVNNEIAKAIK